LFFGGDEFGGKSGRQGESGALLLRGAGAVHVGFFPNRRAGCWRQWFDHHLLHLHQKPAAAVSLESEDAVARNGGVGLGEIVGEFAIDPSPDARALAENAVVVPIPILDGFGEGGRIDRFGDRFVSTGFIVDIAPVTDAGVHLIAGHFMAALLALAADLEAGVLETGALDQTDFEFQVEVFIRAGRGKEGVVRHLFLE